MQELERTNYTCVFIYGAKTGAADSQHVGIIVILNAIDIDHRLTL